MVEKRAHYWAGHFRDEETLNDFTEEQYGDDDKPLSKFIGSQGQRWIDHDFMETHRIQTKSKLKKSLMLYSKTEAWKIEFDSVFKNYSEDGTYVLIMNQYDVDPPYNIINTPQSYSDENILLKYFGETESPF